MTPTGAEGREARGGSSLRTRAAVRHLTRHPLQLALSILGVALGVGVMVAMDLAIQSSREAFRISSETVTGRATHQLTAPAAGIPDSAVALLRLQPGVRHVAPVVEGYVVSPAVPERPLRLLGVDPFAERPFRPWLAGGPGGEVDGSALLATAGAAFISRETALALGVDEGDPLPIRAGARTGELLVAGVLDPGDRSSRIGLRDLILVDVSEAQDLLGRTGRLDRLDLILADAADPGAVLAAAPALQGARLEPAGSRERTMQEMIRAFDLNLTALSLLALIFGVFLIYNTMTFSVVQRRELMGTLRALGVTRAQLVRGVLAEAAVLGAIGSALGLILGILLGRGLVRLVTRTISDLYFAVSVEALALPPAVLLKGAVFGLTATLLAALAPAWEAGRVSPREALARSAVEDTVRRNVPRAAAAGLLLAGAGSALLFVPTRSIGPAFAGLFGIILGMALLTPAATVGLVALLRPALRRIVGILGAMAARGVVTSLSRTAPAIAALVIAVSVTVGLGIMIQSFRESVVRWLDVTLQADLYVSAPAIVQSRAQGDLPPGLAEAARGIPGVAGVSTYRGIELTTETYGLMRLVALDLDPRGRSGLDFIRTAAPRDQIFATFGAGNGAFVSEPFAFRHAVAPGDTLQLPSEEGTLALPVLGVFRDYGSEVGTVMLARTRYDRGWSDPGVGSLGVFLEPGADATLVREALQRAAGPETPVVVRSNRELREVSLEVFDRTFAITRVLRLLAFVVAFIAVLSALMALQLERGREFGVLRANGMTRSQTWGLVTAQTGLMGLISGVLALPVGLVLAVVMIFVVNRRSFGWTLQMELSGTFMAQAIFLALAGALLAGIYPSWRLGRTSPARALRGE
jgi:putative ABC transport system permease protein